MLLLFVVLNLKLFIFSFHMLIKLKHQNIKIKRISILNKKN